MGMCAYEGMDGERYRCELYDEIFDGWQRIDAATHADGARDRVESLWFSRQCPQVGLFETDNVQHQRRAEGPSDACAG